MKEKTSAETDTEYLSLLNRCGDSTQLLKQSAGFFKKLSGNEAVGIRLKDGDDYPYYEASGFPESFVKAENKLCLTDKDGKILRDKAGNPVLECMCGNVIQGRFDVKQPFFTPYGSFFSANTTKLLASTTEKDRQARTRNRCNGEGYESVALIPIKSAGVIYGLLQLNDKKTGMNDLEKIKTYERLTGYLAEALNRIRNADEGGKFREIAVSSFDWSWYYSNGKFEFVSPSCWRITGYPPKEFMDDPGFMLEITAPEDREKTADFYRIEDNVLTKGVEHRVTAKNGSVRWIECYCVTVFDGTGRAVALRGSNRDITQRKMHEDEMAGMMEVMKRKNTDSEDFIKMLSHDIKSPLRTISSFLELIENGQAKRTTEEIKELASIAKHSSYRLAQFVETVLKFSKIREGAVVMGETDPGEALGNACDDLNECILNAGASIHKEQLPSVIADKILLKAVFQNLIENALKYRSSKNPEIKVSAKASGSYVEFCIKDNGIGIEKEFRDKVFEPFTRLLPDSKIEGFGFGLSACRKIVELHSGSIWIESEPGRGTEVYFTLPSAAKKLS